MSRTRELRQANARKQPRMGGKFASKALPGELLTPPDIADLCRRIQGIEGAREVNHIPERAILSVIVGALAKVSVTLFCIAFAAFVIVGGIYLGIAIADQMVR